MTRKWSSMLMKPGRSRIRNVLVVGSWAKEQITAEQLKRDGELTVHAYMDTANPGIARTVDGYRIGSLDDGAAIAEYARQTSADLALLTTAAPLAAGAADRIEGEVGIPAFGPRRSAARLESDKAFARELLAAHVPDAVPSFRVFADETSAVRYARELECEVAIKPIGLTDGLGVKVSGDQLADESDVIEYIREVLGRGIGGESRVIVEERITGEEFTIQCLVDGERFVATPAVQDFKKLLPGERGPNTASMGSYSAAGDLLPFMRPEDRDEALRIIGNTLSAFRESVGEPCRGFLYGQFMLTAKGIRLVEYNFRPGDPEWMNTMAVMESSLVEAVDRLLQGSPESIRFRESATVCKYIVPPGYPDRLNQVLRVRFDEDKVRSLGVRVYHSCGTDDQGRLNVGHERGVAFLAEAPTIVEAGLKVESAIATVEGEFYHRADIGTDSLLEKKIARAEELRG
jgi:phosphoribosylamine--glycine ligase